MDCRQSLVASNHRAVTRFLQVPKKTPYHIRRDVDNQDVVDLLPYVLNGERKKQPECVPVTALRVWGQVPFGHQVFKQKTTDPRPNEVCISHCGPRWLR